MALQSPLKPTATTLPSYIKYEKGPTDVSTLKASAGSCGLHCIFLHNDTWAAHVRILVLFYLCSYGLFIDAGNGLQNEFDTVCNVHRNQLHKQTNKMDFLYVFILQFLYNSTCFERPFRSSSGVHDLLYMQLCTNHANVSNWSVLRPSI